MDLKKKFKQLKKRWKVFQFAKLLRGSKRSVIAVFGYALTYIAGIDPSLAWIGGIGAERLYMSLMFLLGE